MADSPSNWMSFSDYLSLTGDEEKRLMDEAQQRASQLESDAGDKLRIAQSEAMRTGGPLSGASSYGDYVKAKQEAMKAYAMPTTYDPRVAAVQSVVGSGYANAQGAARQRMQQAEAWAAGRVPSVVSTPTNTSVSDFAKRNNGNQQQVINDPGEAYRRWADQVNQRAKQGGGYGSGAYYTGSYVNDGSGRH